MEKDKIYLGIDIGKTKIAAGFVTSSGKVIKREKINTKYEEGIDAILLQTESLIREMINAAETKPIGIGIGIFGVIDSRKGVIIINSAAKGRKNLKIKKHFESKLKIPVLVDNDVNVAALGEHLFGAGSNSRNSVCIMVGTGMGMGIVLHNKIWNGSHSLAGQVGWGSILDEKETWEGFISGRGIEKRILSETGKSIPAKEVFHLAEKGDAKAKEIIEKSVRYAASLLVLVQRMIDPDLIILGGSVVIKQKKFFEDVKKQALHLNNFHKYGIAEAMNISIAKLGNDSGIIGAAAQFLSPKTQGE